MDKRQIQEVKIALLAAYVHGVAKDHSFRFGVMPHEYRIPNLCRDAYTIISEMTEPVSPIVPDEYEGTLYCGYCHETINKNDKFCHECGKAVKWNAKD